MSSASVEAVVFSCCAAFAAPSGVLAQPRIVDLGVPPQGVLPTIESMSDDGRVIVGYFQSNWYPFERAFRWTPETGMVQLPGTDTFWSYARSVNADGTAVAGEGWDGDIRRAFRWTEQGGIENLGTLYGNRNCEGHGISSDGLTVVGSGNIEPGEGHRAFRWRADPGMVRLGTLMNSSYATAVSADGSVVAGDSAFPNWRAFRWTESEGMIGLPWLPDAHEARATGITADGSTIVGYCEVFGPSNRAFQWSDVEGTRDLGRPSGTRSAEAFAISDDGAVVVGSCSSEEWTHACLWSDETGPVDLTEYLASLGLDLTGWELWRATAVSGDGSEVAGQGLFEGQPVAWLVTGLFAPELEISVTGQCPGRQTLTWQGATPGSRLAILFAAVQGSYVIPGGPCAGTALGLGDNRLRLFAIRPAGDGSGSASANVGDSVCGGFVQVIELPSCQTSNVVPVAP